MEDPCSGKDFLLQPRHNVIAEYARGSSVALAHVQVFTSAGLSRQSDVAPTFSTATVSRHYSLRPTSWYLLMGCRVTARLFVPTLLQWLNQPIEVDIINATGGTVWSFVDTTSDPDQGGGRTFMTDMARHAERIPASYTVDTAAAEADFVADFNSTCVVRGFDSRGTNSSIWTITVRTTAAHATAVHQ